MTMLTQIFAAIQEYAWRIIWVGSVLTALEVLVPQVRYSIITRLRSLAFLVRLYPHHSIGPYDLQYDVGNAGRTSLDHPAHWRLV